MTSFEALQTCSQNSLEVAYANYMIYGVIYGGREVRHQAALAINQNEKCNVNLSHFLSGFKKKKKKTTLPRKSDQKVCFGKGCEFQVPYCVQFCKMILVPQVILS